MKHALPLVIALIATPVVAQDAAWNLVASHGQAMLTYGIPDTDDGGPSLSCGADPTMLRASMWVEKRLATDTPREDGSWADANGRPAPWKGELTLSSGKIKVTLPALVHPEEMYGGSIVEAAVPVSSPLVEAILETREIQFESFGERTELPRLPGATPMALIRSCSRLTTP